MRQQALEHFRYPVVFHGAEAEIWHAEKHYNHWCDLSRTEFTSRGIPWSTGTEMFRGMTKRDGDCWHQTSTTENKVRMAEYQFDMCQVSMLLRGDSDWAYGHQVRSSCDKTALADEYCNVTRPDIMRLKPIAVNPAGRVIVHDDDPSEGWDRGGNLPVLGQPRHHHRLARRKAHVHTTRMLKYVSSLCKGASLRS